MSKSVFTIEPFEFSFPQLKVSGKGFLIVEIPANGGETVWHGTDSSPTPFKTEKLAQARLEQLQQQ